MSADERVLDTALLSQQLKEDHCKALAQRTDAICSALNQCVNGIRNLQATYVSDASAQAGLALALQKASCVVDRAAALRSALNTDASQQKQGTTATATHQNQQHGSYNHK